MTYRIALNYTKNITTAEDITQEVFMKVLEHKVTFDTGEHEKAWLIKVTINQCKSYLRTSWFRKTTELKEDVSTQDYIAFTLEQQDLIQQLKRLKSEDRTIVYLFYYEEYSMREIADLMSMNINTVSTRLRRAKEKLRDLLKGDKANGTE